MNVAVWYRIRRVEIIVFILQDVILTIYNLFNKNYLVCLLSIILAIIYFMAVIFFNKYLILQDNYKGRLIINEAGDVERELSEESSEIKEKLKKIRLVYNVCINLQVYMYLFLFLFD